MCATAISFARIRRLYFGAADPKGGGVEHGPRIFSQTSCHHAPEVYGGIEETRAGELAAEVFRRPPLSASALSCFSSCAVRIGTMPWRS